MNTTMRKFYDKHTSFCNGIMVGFGAAAVIFTASAQSRKPVEIDGLNIDVNQGSGAVAAHAHLTNGRNQTFSGYLK